VNDLIFTSDNQYLISASADTTLMIWSVCTGNRLHTFRGHTDSVVSCSLTRNNQRMVSASHDGTVRIWLIESGVCAAVMIHPFPLLQNYDHVDVKFCNHDQYIIVAWRYIDIQLWTVTGRFVRKIYTPDTTRVLELDEVRFLCTDMNHHTVQVRKYVSGMSLQTFRRHLVSVDSARFVQENTMVVSCDKNDTLYIWRVGDGVCTHQFPNYAMPLRLQLNPVKCWLETENTEGIIVYTPEALHILAVNSGEIIFTFPIQLQREEEMGIQISFDGRFFVWNDHSIIRFFVTADHKNITHKLI